MGAGRWPTDLVFIHVLIAATSIVTAPTGDLHVEKPREPHPHLEAFFSAPLQQCFDAYGTNSIFCVSVAPDRLGR